MLTISRAYLLLLTGSTGVHAVDLKLSAANIHWGYFSKTLDPVLTVESGTEVTVEMATHHGCDDYDKMILGDPAMEEIFTWDKNRKVENFRGATGVGDGVHILTGPIFVNGAEPGDLLKVEILDLQPRPNKDGKTYGSNAAAWWGYQARVPTVDGTDFTAGSFTGTPGSNDEVVTIYEIKGNYAVPAYQFDWPVLKDPMGEERDYIAYPGTCVPHDPHGATTTVSSTVADMGWIKEEGSITYHDDVFPAKIPLNYHVGCLGLAPASHDFVDSIPPMPSGGNLDNKRIGMGTTMYCKCSLNLRKVPSIQQHSCFLPLPFLPLASAIAFVLIK
jgi:acetamidase/formamidase